MISYLKGILQFIGENYIILDVNNIGFKIHIPTSVIEQLPSINEEVRIKTYLHIREDEFTLFGFMNYTEVDMFELLLTVSGIGPKGAIAILSVLSPQRLHECIVTEDIKTLTTIPGIGQKTAKKIIFELKDKMLKMNYTYLSTEDKPSNNTLEAVNVLEALGYSPAESLEVIKKLDINLQSTSVENIVKYALKKMGSQI
ncbi:MAG TPA: Holliday junction branch migration protein RuvA [Thermoanaerobacterales bacterium]|nr:Holliday junction branch migration protein RuvA [Thermoanaerobacterales bacterium]